MEKKIYYSLADKLKPVNSRLIRFFIKPSSKITDPAEISHISLISAILLFSALSILSGAIYMTFFSQDPGVGKYLAILLILIIITYLLSRTKYYKLGAVLSLIAATSLSIFNTLLKTDHSIGGLLHAQVWTVMPILVCSIITSYRNTIIYIAVNITILLFFPILFEDIYLINLMVPLIFILSASILILISIHSRNKQEKVRLSKISEINEQLKNELKQRKQVENEIAHSATHDSLTNLPNRVLFTDRLQHLMNSAKRLDNIIYAVLFLDLDRFKIINDTLGHDAGNRLLSETASRLQNCLRSQDTVSRFGGDEFVILLENIIDSTDATRIANRILHDISIPFDVSGHKIHLTASIGIVQGNNKYTKPDEIIRDADIAMYRSKSKGPGSYEIFDPQMLEYITTKLEQERELRQAFERNEFMVYYQPIHNLSTQTITGFEALLRWSHPKKGMIQPIDFIPIAEETGLIIPLGYWVLDEACRQINIWQNQYPAVPPLTVSVNLSNKQCATPNLVQEISAIIKKNKIAASSLKLELTESLIVKDPESTALMLAELREMGVEVQIDDFGTGYSSLGYLHTLPIDTLKIDRVFIERLGADDNGSDIVRTILALAKNLNMKAVAEGVETEDQLSILDSMNCNYVQGFLFAKPVSCLDADNMLKKAFDKNKKK